MRPIFSIRFLAALAAIAVLLTLLVAARIEEPAIGSAGGDQETANGVVRHRIDFVDQVYFVDNPSFALTEDGLAASDTGVVIDGQRAVRIVAGTPGEIDCPATTEINRCAIVADLLGESVVWFALVPHNEGQTVEFPAIDVLEDGRAVLVNGWELPYAPILDRRCPDREWDSYRSFRADLGDQFVSLYDIDEARLVAVVCDRTVPWVTTTTTIATPTTTSTLPPSSVPSD